MSRTATRWPRIICVGANDKSRTVLLGLLEDGADIVAVVTHQPGSGDGITDYADLHDLCAQRGIPCIDTDDINDPDTVRAMEELGADYVFVLGWSQLLGAAALAIPGGYVVGSHPSLLPTGRGRAPVPWAILLGERSGAVTLFRMEAGADSGRILLQRRFEIPARSDAGTLYALTATHLREAFRELYRALSSGPLEGEAQDELKASYRARRVPADGHIDFHQPRDAVDLLVRAATRPFPGAYTFYRGRRIVVWRSDVASTPDYVGVPGQILRKADGRLLVRASEAPLWLWDFSDDEQRGVDISTFETGETFGYRIEDTLHRLETELAELRARLAGA